MKYLSTLLLLLLVPIAHSQVKINDVVSIELKTYFTKTVNEFKASTVTEYYSYSNNNEYAIRVSESKNEQLRTALYDRKTQLEYFQELKKKYDASYPQLGYTLFENKTVNIDGIEGNRLMYVHDDDPANVKILDFFVLNGVTYQVQFGSKAFDESAYKTLIKSIEINHANINEKPVPSVSNVVSSIVMIVLLLLIFGTPFIVRRVRRKRAIKKYNNDII